MLKRFEVSGFKNFKDTITLDFSDVRNYNFSTSCITDKTIGKMITPKNVTPGLYDYYLNVSCLTDYAEFHYVFQFDDNIIDYRYRKLDNQSLIYEKLVLDGSLLYEFDYRKHKGIMDGITKLAPTTYVQICQQYALVQKP